MVGSFDRRAFLRSGAAAGGLAAMGNLSFLGRLDVVHADQTHLDGAALGLTGNVGKVVSMLMQTPRERLLEEVASRIQQGLSYRDLLGGLLLAGVTNIEPRPEVGFKFHAVLVVNSAHLASLASPPEHRWLPIFWALDYYKDSEARDVKERGDWRMQPADESAIPVGSKAREAFVRAMDGWDEPAADAAVTGLARTAGVNEIAELFYRYGCRDFRSIGHKAIYVANSVRTLDCIGWEHSEPVLRSLAYALLNHEGSNPAERDADADRPFRENSQRIGKIRADWVDGRVDDSATAELLATFRTGTDRDACEAVLDVLNSGVSPQSVWDALHVGAGELLLRQPGIVALHAVTTTNALQFAFRASGIASTRQLLLLQNAAFLPMFRDAMQRRGKLMDRTVDVLDAETGKQPQLDEIFAELRESPLVAAQKTASFLRSGGKPQDLIDAARLLVFLKGNDAHDYKFSSAILEDCFHVSPKWQGTYLAANMLKLQSSADPDNALVARTRAALG